MPSMATLMLLSRSLILSFPPGHRPLLMTHMTWPLAFSLLPAPVVHCVNEKHQIWSLRFRKIKSRCNVLCFFFSLLPSARLILVLGVLKAFSQLWIISYPPFYVVGLLGTMKDLIPCSQMSLVWGYFQWTQRGTQKFCINKDVFCYYCC